MAQSIGQALTQAQGGMQRPGNDRSQAVALIIQALGNLGGQISNWGRDARSAAAESRAAERDQYNRSQRPHLEAIQRMNLETAGLNLKRARDADAIAEKGKQLETFLQNPNNVVSFAESQVDGIAAKQGLQKGSPEYKNLEKNTKTEAVGKWWNSNVMQRAAKLPTEREAFALASKEIQGLRDGDLRNPIMAKGVMALSDKLGWGRTKEIEGLQETLPKIIELAKENPDIAALAGLWDMDKKTGEPVFNETYAKEVVDYIRDQVTVGGSTTQLKDVLGSLARGYGDSSMVEGDKYLPRFISGGGASGTPGEGLLNPVGQIKGELADRYPFNKISEGGDIREALPELNSELADQIRVLEGIVQIMGKNLPSKPYIRAIPSKTGSGITYEWESESVFGPTKRSSTLRKPLNETARVYLEALQKLFKNAAADEYVDPTTGEKVEMPKPPGRELN